MRYLLPVLLSVAVLATGCETKKTVTSGEQEASIPKKVVKATPKQPEAKTDASAKADAKPDAKPDAKADAKPDAKADAKILGIGSTPANIPAGTTGQYGAKFTLNTEPIALASAIKSAEKSPGPYKVKATIAQVCQVKGCWFTLKAPGVPIPVRVKMKGYKFFVPKNAGDADAILEGTFKKTQLSVETARHYAKDAGKDPSKITKPQDTYMFKASAIQITSKKAS